ncbi:MAG: TonB-dependent receptor [Bacteroidales bacterium]|nr:TonB-dependent receptor [Bacteroidales bacterium]
MKKVLTSIFFSFLAITSFSQVRGVVKDQKGNALIGANVVWKDTNIGTTTDAQGAFILEKHDSDAIVTTYIGFNNDTTAYNGAEFVEITLSGEDITLDNVVVKAQRPGRMKAKGAENIEITTSTELCRAACCNLGESFSTNPSVDVDYSDAATGAKQIKLLGLSGSYVQMLTENVPAFRGAAAPFSLGYIPGTWMHSIQVSKGAATVKNGYESITGQINVEYLKPQLDEELDVNLFLDSHLKLEANIEGNYHFNDALSTGVLAHYENMWMEHDGNGDGFMDMPKVQQYDFMNRWMYKKDHYIMQAYVKALKEDRNGGQTEEAHNHSKALYSDNQLYKIKIGSERYEGVLKNAYIFDEIHNTNVALILSGSIHKMNSLYGLKTYDVNNNNAYAQLMFETEFTPSHSISTGLSFNHDCFDELWKLELMPNLVKAPDENIGGAYAQYTFNYDERFVFMAGFRGDYSDLYGLFFTPRAHVKWVVGDLLKLRFSAGKGYRTPRPMLDNHTLLSSSRDIVVDENLKQEEAWNYGATASFDIDIFEKCLIINLEYYYTNFTNQVVTDLDTDPHAVHFANLDGLSYSHTFQIDATYPFFEGFSLLGAFRYNDVKTTINGVLREKPLSSRYKGLVTLTYKTPLEIWQFDVTMQFNGGGRMPDPYVKADGTMSWGNAFDSYALLNAQILKWFRWGNIYIGGENLTNFKQKNPIIGCHNPFGENFDATMIWGPVDGIMVYAGIKWKLSKY